MALRMFLWFGYGLLRLFIDFCISYGVSLWSVFDIVGISLREMCPYSEFFQSKCGKIRTRKTPIADAFHEVFMLNIHFFVV